MIRKIKAIALGILIGAGVQAQGGASMTFGFNDPADSLLTTGLMLYALDDAKEVALETVVGLFNVKDLKDWISYVENDSLVNILFLEKGKPPRVRYHIQFTFPYDPRDAVLKSSDRDLTDLELSLIRIDKKINKRLERLKVLDSLATSISKFYLTQPGGWEVHLVPEKIAEGRIYLGGEQYWGYTTKGKKFQQQTPNRRRIELSAELPAGAHPDDFASFNVHGKGSSNLASCGEVYTLIKCASLIPWENHVVQSESHITLINFKIPIIQVFTKEQWMSQMGM